MSIHDLLAKFDAKDLKVQFTTDCLSDIRATRKGSRIVLHTDALTCEAIASGTDPVGVLVWVPRDKWKAMQGAMMKEVK